MDMKKISLYSLKSPVINQKWDDQNKKGKIH